MSQFSVCVIYYSLPSLPEACALVTQHDLVPRDVLLCNRSNDHHILGGMQYDPNIENAEYRICEPRVRAKLQRQSSQYDNLYLLFRTRHFNQDGSSNYLVTGFYDVERDFTDAQCLEKPIVHARAMHFVSLADSIDITELMKERKSYRCCFTSENPFWRPHLESWVNQLSQAQNQTNRYVEEINNLKNIFYDNEFHGANYETCTNCTYCNRPDACFLTWRRRHRTIPHRPANYMKSLDEYFASLQPGRSPVII